MTVFSREFPPEESVSPTARLSTTATYELRGEVGRGAMGIVYRAIQVGLDRAVALKVVRAGAGATPRVLACFRAEARALARLHHPAVVRAIACGEHDGLPCLALELLPGGTLARRLRGTAWPADPAAVLVQSLARGVAHAHRRGVLHLDLKPANVVFTARGRPKLIDFGLARFAGDSPGPGDDGAVMGTPGYMAPEQAAGEVRKVGTAADVYGLGAILYELLAGRPPFLAATRTATLREVCRGEVVRPGRLQPGTPQDLETICLRCLRKAPGERYPGALSLANDLGRFLRQGGTAAQRRSA